MSDDHLGDKQAILGYWKLVACVQDDRQLKFCDIGKIYEFTSTHFRMVSSGRSGPEYDLYPDRTPKAIDQFISRPDNMVVRGIYELDADELRLLFHPSSSGDEQSRPTSMTGLRGHSSLAVSVYKRSHWRPPRNRQPKQPKPITEPGSLIPTAFLKKNK